MAVALEAALDEAAELGGEGVVVEEVVDAQAGAGGLAGVCWADALLGGADAELQGEEARGRECGERSLPRSSEFDLLQSVDDLVEVEDELGTIGHEESARAVKAYSDDDREG